MRIFSAHDEPPAPSANKSSWRLTALLLAIIFAVLYASYYLNRSCLMVGLDGISYATYLEYQSVDREPFTQTGVDASEGNFDAYYPLFHEYLFPGALALPFSVSMPSKNAIYFIYAVACLFAFYVSARAVDVNWATALLAGLIADVIGLPGLVHHISQSYANFSLNPFWIQNLVLSMLTVASFWAIRVGHWPPKPRALAISVVPTLCLLMAIISTGPQVFFMVPALALYSSASLMDADRWQENTMRVVSATLMLAASAALGIFGYYYGLVGYTAYNFFSAEFERNLFDLSFASTFWYSDIGCLAIILGIVGAAWTAYASTGRLRLFAITHLAVTAIFLPVGYTVVNFAKNYHGSMPIYFEQCVWPYVVLFSAIAILTSVKQLARTVSWVNWRIKMPRELWLVARGGRLFAQWPATERIELVVLAAALFLVAAYNAAEATVRSPMQCPVAGFSPIKATAITDYLQQRVALTPGASFNGLVATIDGLKGKSSVNWSDLTIFDYLLWRDTGNDHRSAGLWRYRIPTLFQYYTFITPPYYLLLTEFLARPTDRQTRSVLVLSRANKTMMRLWGVRYVITDTDLGIGDQLVELPTDQNAPFKLDPLRLVELSDVNLGSFSPTEVRRVDDFRAGLALMHEAAFDGARSVIVDVGLEGPFTAATNAQLVYTSDGFHLRADSTSRSLLVLPVQYSHCWTVNGAGDPTLFRANMMQIGVSFTGNLDARLVFRYGPILASQCRLEDLHDMYQLRITEARGRSNVFHLERF